MTERRPKAQQGAVAKSPPGAKTDAGAPSDSFGADPAPAEAFSDVQGLRLKADRFKGDYAYVPLECPRCGLAGKVKISRLDRTFTCKQCKRVFHITVFGVVNGEAPPPDVLPDPDAPIKSQRANRLERWFSRLPPLLRWSVAGALVGALPVMAMLVSKLLADPFPADLGERAVIAGQAFAKGDRRTLDRLVLSGTSEALHEWYDKTPRVALAGLDIESNVQATVASKGELYRRFEKDEKGAKKPVADMQTRVEIQLPEREGEAAKFDVDFVWVKSNWGKWQIDGECMLELAGSNTSAARAAAVARAKALPPARRREKN